MPTLRIQLSLAGDGSLGSGHVVANLYPIAPPSSNTTPAPPPLRNLRVPAGDPPDSWFSQEVAAGEYDLEVALPSGDLLWRKVSVPTAAEDTPVDVIVKDTHVVAAEERGSRRPLPPRRDAEDGAAGPDWRIMRSIRRAALGPHAGSDLSVRRSPRPLEVRWLTPPLLREPAEIWQMLRAPNGRLDPRWNRGSESSDEGHGSPPDKGRAPSSYRFRANGPVSLPTSADESLPIAKERRYVLVKTHESTRIFVAPVPWFRIDDPSRAHIEVDFELLAGTDSSGLIATVRDVKARAILGYLASHSPDRARLLVDDASDFLFEKNRNPLSAAAGAYVLLATDSTKENPPWQHWIRNLHARFPWLPDGAVLLASLRLERQRSEQDVSDALNLFLEAYKRGLPFYSQGIRLLLDGLVTFASDEAFAERHAEIGLVLDHVRAVARSVDYRQPFTAIRLPSP